MNPFRQKIGIFYKDKEWVEEIKSHIYRDTLNDIIWCSEDAIYYKNHDYVTFVPEDTTRRGRRYTKSFIQKGIDQKNFYEVIAPINLCHDCLIISDYDGLFYFGERYDAYSYYGVRSQET